MKESILLLRVYAEDTDFGGVMYHANYLKYFERARAEWAERIGVGADWQLLENMILPVRSVQLEYLKPARLHQLVEVVSRIHEVRTASMIFDQYLRLHEQPDTILCKAQIRVACVDKTIRPRALPKRFLDIINGELA